MDLVTPAPTPTPAAISGVGIYNDSILSYSAGWQTSTGNAKFQADDHYSNTAGATATMKFTGTGLMIYGVKLRTTVICRCR